MAEWSREWWWFWNLNVDKVVVGSQNLLHYCPTNMIISPLSPSPLSPSPLSSPTPSSSSWWSSTRTTCRRPRPACPQYSDPYLLAFEPTEDPRRDPWQTRSIQNWPRFGPNSNIEPPKKVSGQSYLLVSMPTGDPLHVAILRPLTVFVTEIPKSLP